MGIHMDQYTIEVGEIPIDSRSSILRPQNTYEGLSARFCLLASIKKQSHFYSRLSKAIVSDFATLTHTHCSLLTT